jgi:DNA-binding NarL/FixJ family response regulator
MPTRDAETGAAMVLTTDNTVEAVSAHDIDEAPEVEIALIKKRERTVAGDLKTAEKCAAAIEREHCDIGAADLVTQDAAGISVNRQIVRIDDNAAIGKGAKRLEVVWVERYRVRGISCKDGEADTANQRAGKLKSRKVT